MRIVISSCVLGIIWNISCRTGTTSIDVKQIDTAMALTDNDGDGYLSDEDCDDGSGVVHPGAIEVCDGIDNNCDGEIDEDVLVDFFFDQDNDGFGDSTESIEACQPPDNYVPNGNDCNDNDATIYPSASERCDNQDNDCDEEIDEDLLAVWFLDADGDGFGDNRYILENCLAPPEYVDNDLDCDDENPDTNPNAMEICDEIDNDCDQDIDEGLTIALFLDADHDGFGDDASIVDVCDFTEGVSDLGGDCDDINSSVYPGATEYCDGIDNNCDSVVDESSAENASTWYRDQDNDGFGEAGNSTLACFAGFGFVSNADDCNDSNISVYPNAPEICDGIVNMCGGTLPNTETDDDGDGYVECSIDPSGWDGTTITGGNDCDDNNILLYPNAIWYADLDGDGFGNANSTLTSCLQPANTVATSGDCNDTNASVYPNAPEICDGIVNMCGGTLPNTETDDDGDGYVECSIDPSGWDGASITGGNDCDDNNTLLHPSTIWYADLDSDGFGNANSSTVSCVQPSNTSNNGSDCLDTDNTVYPNAVEICDGLDTACTGTIPATERDLDQDGYIACTIDTSGWDGANITGDQDCNDTNASIHPNAIEIVGDEIDSNCDGGEICVLDFDQDGHGNSNGQTIVSVDPDCADAQEVSNAIVDDCDDSNALLNPVLGCYGTDCADILAHGWGNTDATYTIDPDGAGPLTPYNVYCDMTTDGGGWTRITHLHSNRDIGSIKRNAPFFSAAWQQNSSTFTNTSNAQLVLDNTTYGMLDATSMLQSATDVRLSCVDNTRNLSAKAIWTPSSSNLQSWLQESTDTSEYLSSAFPVSMSRNNGSWNNANVYFTHTEDAYFGSWHICGVLSAASGGFQLGFCHNSPANTDYGLSNINQIVLGYHAGFAGLRLECGADSPANSSIINGTFSIWVR